MNFTGIYNSSLRWRGLTTSLFMTLTSRGELMVPWSVRSNENLPTRTCTWTLDHITLLPTCKLFFESWCTESGLCMTRKASMMSWISTRPHFRENSYSIKQTLRVLNPVVRSSKPKDKPTSVALLPYVQTTYGRHSRMLAKHIKSVGLQPRKISSFLRPVKDDLGLEGIQHTLWVWPDVHRTDWSINWAQSKGAPPTHTAWTSRQIGCGGTQFQTCSSHKIPRQPYPLYCT